MYQNDANRKTCSTCDYWMGEREIGHSGRVIYVRHNGTSAECEVSRTGKKSGNVNAQGCRYYKKWSHLG